MSTSGAGHAPKNGLKNLLPSREQFTRYRVGFAGLFVLVVLEVIKKQTDDPRRKQDLGVTQLGLFVIVVAQTLWVRSRTTATKASRSASTAANTGATDGHDTVRETTDSGAGEGGT